MTIHTQYSIDIQNINICFLTELALLCRPNLFIYLFLFPPPFFCLIKNNKNLSNVKMLESNAFFYKKKELKPQLTKPWLSWAEGRGGGGEAQFFLYIFYIYVFFCPNLITKPFFLYIHIYIYTHSHFSKGAPLGGLGFN